MTIKIIDLAQEAEDKQAIYLKKIAQWFKAEWGMYRPDKPNLADWKITELKLNEMPITLIALDIQSIPKLAGVARLKYDDLEGLFPQQNKYRLSGLYVDTAYRRQGIGLQLIKQILTIADSKGAKEIWLFSHSKQAKDYYLKQGWTYQYDKKIHSATASVLYADIKALLQKLIV